MKMKKLNLLFALIIGMSMMACGWDVISFFSGSLIVVRFGWSLALGWRPAMVFRLVWYLLGLFCICHPLFF